MFLPDRYIKGECPKCGTKDQYGDSCENCGAVYAPTDLKNPYSALTGAKPVLKKSEHFFFRLSDPRCVEFLRELDPGRQAPARGLEQGARVARRGPERLGHHPRRALLRHRDPRRQGQVLLRLARRAHRLPRLAQELPREEGPGLRQVPRRPEARADPLHRQGHHLLPHALLAGDAQVLRAQGAGQRVRARLPAALGREDVASRAASR